MAAAFGRLHSSRIGWEPIRNWEGNFHHPSVSSPRTRAGFALSRSTQLLGRPNIRTASRNARIRPATSLPTRNLMNTDLTEEEMRRALFGSPAPATQVTASPASTPILDIVPAPPARPLPKQKVAKAFTSRLRVTMQVGNEFEGKTFEFTHEADTLSTLLAQQEAVKAARKKYRYVEVVSVKSM